MISLSRLVAFAVVIVATSGCTEQSADYSSGTGSATVLSNATIIIGNGDSPRHNQSIVIIGSRIKQVGDNSDIEIAPDAVVIDLTGKWVTPGFIDLHVHFPSEQSVHGAILDRLLQFGVTTILNPGARPGAGVALREKIRIGELRGPRMRTAGPIIDDTPADRGYGMWATQTPSIKAIRREIVRQAQDGVDFVKFYAGLNTDLVVAGVDEARSASVRSVGHLESASWTTAANAGINMLVHSGWSTPMDEIVNLPDPESASDPEWYEGYADAPNGLGFGKLVDALVRNNVVVVPTLSITQAGSFGKDNKLLPRFRTEIAPERDLAGWWGEGWRERHPQYEDSGEEENQLIETIFFPAVLTILKAYYDHGVTLGVGTDVGNAWMTPGASFHYELFLYQEAGIPPIDILTMATKNGALALGLESVTGTVEAGKSADLVVLGADPVKDIRNTQYIEDVFVGGQSVSPP